MTARGRKQSNVPEIMFWLLRKGDAHVRFAGWSEMGSPGTGDEKLWAGGCLGQDVMLWLRDIRLCFSIDRERF